MILVDTSVWIAVFKRDGGQGVVKFDAIPDKTRIIVADIVLLEVLQGARDEAQFRRLEAFLRRFAIVSVLGEKIAMAAARNYRTLRGLGVTIRKTPDTILATYCIEEGHSLLHQDKDFVPFAQHLGLNVL